MIKDIIVEHLNMLKHQTIGPITSDDGYSHCGLEDMLAESLDSDIIKYTKLLEYIEGRYIPDNVQELKDLHQDIMEVVNSFVSMMHENLKYEADMQYYIADEKLHDNN